jgi:hypothetical protein
MPTTVINAGHWERTTSGARNTNLRKSFGEIGTITVEYEGQTYVFGPGEQKSLDNGIAAALVAGNSNLRLADTREGNRATGRS